jgi:carbon storage regulator
MLVVSRCRKQKIRIADNIIIEVIDITGDEVKIGVEAPKSIPILRGELLGPCKKVEKELGE